MLSHRIPIWRSAAYALAVGLVTLTAFGQEPAKNGQTTETPPKTAAPTAGKVADPGDLEAFFDGVLNVQLKSKHVAGAVVAVVVGDKLVFSKGYGYADIDARRKVDPEKTMFRIASISKLFTWTAVMQQVEEGKLDLEADINGYLKDVQIPGTFPQPITLKNMLTHTPGFDDVVIGLFARQPEKRPLAEVLRDQMPTRVRPPGKLSCYSNHGTAMAGYAVACVSGMSWEDYIEKRILKPLGMEHTLARQPSEEDMPADMSKGYKWKHDQFKVEGFEYVPTAPAGCMSTTAADAAKFMIAHLNDGQGTAGRILKPETARRMREPLFRHDPKTSAMCYGFMEEQLYGKRMVGHGGDTLWFHSLLQLIPDEHVGFFVSYNTDTAAAGAREQLFSAFLKHYFPEADPPRPVPTAEARAHAKKLAGEYGVTRYSHTTLGKLAALLSAFDVAANDDGTITIGFGDNATRCAEVEPRVFRDVNGTATFVFQEDGNGRGQYLFPANMAPMSTIRREWYESSVAQWSLLGVSLAILATAILFWPAIAFSVRGLQSPKIRRTRFSGFLSCLAWLLGIACVAFAAGLGYVLNDANEIVFGLPPLLKALVTLTAVCAGLAALTVIGCLIAWWQGYWRLSGRLHYTLVALAGVGFTFFLYNWNLLPLGPGRM
jgi:CubicO group peptidase (beta-lactamase class C family)